MPTSPEPQSPKSSPPASADPEMEMICSAFCPEPTGSDEAFRGKIPEFDLRQQTTESH